jgi:hypothetical protein
MLMEEKMLLMGRGTASGFSGTIAAPSSITLTARAAVAGETPIVGSGDVEVWASSDAGAFGCSNVQGNYGVSYSAGEVVEAVITGPADALGYLVFVEDGTSTSPGNAYYQGRTGSNTFVIQGAIASTGDAASQHLSVNTSAYANGYDGILPIVTGADSGYTKVLNSSWNATSPGAEFQDQFAALYNSVKADPDEILFNGTDRKNLSELLKNSSSNNYRLTLQQDEIGNAVLGSVITAIQNEVTGKVVPMTVHPWMPQGNTATLSYTLPIPDSQVSNVWSVVNVQDYMGIQWPVVDFQYQASSYWLGTFVCYAPAWNGSITGIAA